MTKQRVSEYSKSKKKKWRFEPTIEDWRQAARICPYDIQMAKFLGTSHETFFAFLDKQRYIVENGGESAYVESYYQDRKKTRIEIADKFLGNIQNGDVASTIVGMKCFNGMLEQREIEHIELKKQELTLRSNAFLTDLAESFGLDKKELKHFADKYFQGLNLDSIFKSKKE